MGEFDAFKKVEVEGWQKIQGEKYHNAAKVVAPLAIPHLLDLAPAFPGAKVMVLACGPGYGVTEAAECGADPVGVDISEPMLGYARVLFPEHRFEWGDAEQLNYQDASFDTVICSFGVLHFAYPQKVFSEVRRVLKPGGRFAFSVWGTPDRNPFFGLILQAVMKHGSLNVSLPQGPDMFLFANHENSKTILEKSGFTSVQTRDVEVSVKGDESDEDVFVRNANDATVRTRLLLEAQSEPAREAIFEELRDVVRNGVRNGEGTMEMPFCMVCIGGQKPVK
jgi:ubiquinone/menaquinone biosynthesis C-methylase UbiE